MIISYHLLLYIFFEIKRK